MTRKYNVLVTGNGGDIGQSVGKILKSHPMFSLVVGSDLNDQHAGKFIYDESVTVPRCTSPAYQSALAEIVNRFNIDLIIPVSEPELRFFTENSVSETFLDKPIILASLRAREIGFDKYLTANFLKEEGLPFPMTAIASELNDPQLPLILKDRKGSGSKSLFQIYERDDFDFYAKKYPDFIAQELIGNSEQEYTCGIFRDSRGSVRIINFKRRLMGGFTGFGIVCYDKKIDDLLAKIATRLNLNGSINVQLRLSSDGTPVVFEINPRFSSTVMFRHLLGFEDVIWSIQDALKLPISEYLPPENGKQFYKGFNEYIE